MSNSVRPDGLQPARLLCPRNSPGQNTRVGCHALPQGIFPTQGSNPCLLRLPHQRQILDHWATGEAPTLLCTTHQLNTKAYIFNELSPQSNHLPSPHKRSAKSPYSFTPIHLYSADLIIPFKNWKRVTVIEFLKYILGIIIYKHFVFLSFTLWYRFHFKQ